MKIKDSDDLISPHEELKDDAEAVAHKRKLVNLLRAIATHSEAPELEVNSAVAQAG